jgi:hypothetical protein
MADMGAYGGACNVHPALAGSAGAWSQDHGACLALVGFYVAGAWTEFTLLLVSSWMDAGFSS